jgi:hypothetical protein
MFPLKVGYLFTLLLINKHQGNFFAGMPFQNFFLIRMLIGIVFGNFLFPGISITDTTLSY